MPLKLDAIPKGFRDIYEGESDEPIENPIIVARSGSATQSVKLLGDKKVEVTVNGDGAVGENNSFAVQVDGHIGEGDAPIVNEFEYDVVSPDATVVNFAKVRREPIPAE